MNKPLPKDTVRIIKIDKDALYEFIYENFLASQESLMDVDSTKCMNNFAIDWETGSFIFTAHNVEDENDGIVPFPADIDIKRALYKIPSTTSSVLSPDKNYKDYTFDELRNL